MAWLTALSDLRVFLSDGPTDRIHYRKKCFGEVNGVNKRFKTFEFRRVTDFVTVPGVWINNVLQPVAKIAADDLATGEFILATAPAASTEGLIEASYYTQWFLDSELTVFLQDAALWINESTDYTLIQNSLIPAAKKYAAAEGYLKMAQRWRTYESSVYKVEDAPKDEAAGRAKEYTEMATTFRKEALDARTEYYKTRQGRAMQPLFGVVQGNIPNLP